jgi:hypothetical protein
MLGHTATTLMRIQFGPQRHPHPYHRTNYSNAERGFARCSSGGEEGAVRCANGPQGRFAATSEIADLVETRGQMMMLMQGITMDFSSGRCG